MATNDDIVLEDIVNGLSNNNEVFIEPKKAQRIGAFGKVKSTKGEQSEWRKLSFYFWLVFRLHVEYSILYSYYYFTSRICFNNTS